MFIVAAAALVAAMVMMLVRAFAGPTLYDRVLAGNSFGTKTVLLIGVMGFIAGRPDFLDIAILYAILNFASTIAILKFFRYRTLSVAMSGATADSPQFRRSRGSPRRSRRRGGASPPAVRGRAPPGWGWPRASPEAGTAARSGASAGSGSWGPFSRRDRRRRRREVGADRARRRRPAKRRSRAVHRQARPRPRSRRVGDVIA